MNQTIKVALLLLGLCQGILLRGGLKNLRFENISLEQGLSQTTINCILLDRRGFMWFGTQDGLNRYDGYEFLTYMPRSGRSTSLSNSFVLSLLEDRDGYIWIGTDEGGLNRFDPETGLFQQFPLTPKAGVARQVWSIVEDGDKGLWVGTNVGLYLIGPDGSPKASYHHDPQDPQSLSDNRIRSLLVDDSGELWVGTKNGLNRLLGSGGFQRYSRKSTVTGMNPNEIWALHQGDRGLWVGSDEGLDLLDTEKNIFQDVLADTPGSEMIRKVCAIVPGRGGILWVALYEGGLVALEPGFEPARINLFRNDQSNPYSLSANNILSICEGAGGDLWVGTLTSGVNRADRGLEIFTNYQHNSLDPQSLGGRSVRSVCRDKDDVLWVGTDNGLSRYDAQTSTFRHYRHSANNPESISHNLVSALLQSQQGQLWVGTRGGGLNLFKPEAGGSFVRFQKDPNKPNGLSDDHIRTLYEDSKGVLWIGTRDGGLNRYDGNGFFTHFTHDPNEPESGPGDNTIKGLYEDRQGRLWIGTLGGGLSCYMAETGKFTTYPQGPINGNGLSSSRVRCIVEDSDQGWLYLATAAGLNRFDPNNPNAVRVWREADGLPNDSLYEILVDARGLLWISSNKGLICFDPGSETSRTFNGRDGLQSNEFNGGAWFADTDGKMYFGGVNGLTVFHPDQARFNTHPPLVSLTSFSLLNRVVEPRGLDPESVLAKPIEATDALTINHRDKVVSFRFAALHFADPQRNQYAYRLDGFDEDWITTDSNNRQATYTNLDPKAYTFRVKASNKHGVWNEAVRLKLVVKPPLWRRWWAFAVYSLAFGSLVLLYLQIQRRKLEYERGVNEKLKQVDRLKDEFLANTSHELRTPLNGIIGLAESLNDGAAGEVNPEQKANLMLLASSGKRLANLVDDLLDFAKIKKGNLELAAEPVDMRALTDVVFTLTRPLIRGKELQLINHIPTSLEAVMGDENRLQQVMYNLIDNAVKFTEKGTVTVSAKREGEMLNLSVSDTGIGIAAKKCERIFESFEQADGTIVRNYGGTGLGLAITRQLINLHGGNIRVESTLGEGTTFTFSLALWKGTLKPDKEKVSRLQADIVSIDHDEQQPAFVDETVGGRFHILIVDDDPINRQVLRNHLKVHEYRISEAGGGEQAMALLASEASIDLVILDVMMPRISGYEVCRELRQNKSNHELPVIFLTARNRIDDRVSGFEAGANDFLVKPVGKSELLLRVETHLSVLDVKRNLAHKVAERTEMLAAQNRELETLDRIVRVINREQGLDGVLDTILEEGIALIPNAEKGVFLLWEKHSEEVELAASLGYDLKNTKGLKILRDEVVARYTVGTQQIEEGIFILKPQNSILDKGNLTPPKSVLAMALQLEERLEGFLVLDNLHLEDAFVHADSRKLARLRDHAVTAIAKARAMRDLIRAQRELISAAHESGMAEIASEVLHNVGNVLNSVRTSGFLIQETAQNDYWLRMLDKSCSFLENEGKRGIDSEQSKKLARLLGRVKDALDAQRKNQLVESARVDEGLQTILEMLHNQRELAGGRETAVEVVDLNKILEETAESWLPTHQKIQMDFCFQALPAVRLQVSKFRRLIYFLLENAWTAIVAKGPEGGCRVRLLTSCDKDGVVFQVIDNGVVLKNGNPKSVFAFNHQSEKKAHWFGLHYCANMVNEMAGKIEVEDLEEGGNRVTIRLPCAS